MLPYNLSLTWASNKSCDAASVNQSQLIHSFSIMHSILITPCMDFSAVAGIQSLILAMMSVAQPWLWA